MERNKLIDSSLNLKDLVDDEDVIFEFYYNRVKISCLKTIYELVNYQPTYRSIADPYIIYFRIVDRKTNKGTMSSSDDSGNLLTQNVDEENRHILHKEKVLNKAIYASCEGLDPVIASFMKRFISPFIKPDVKKEINPMYYNPNQYTYNQQQPNKTPVKIGESATEQRLISKKALKISEAISYVLKYWYEIKLNFNFLDKEKIVAKPEELFKHLLDQYVQKLLLEPLNLVLEYKKHKCYELMEILMGNPNLLNFETRVFFFKSATFAYSGEFNRTVNCLVQHLRKKYNTIPDHAIPKQSKEKVRIDRKKLLESAVNLLTTPGRIKRKNFLEIEY